MIRLCGRVGVRTIAIGLLVLGLVGGLALAGDRTSQRRLNASARDSQIEADELHQLRLDQNARWQAGASQRAAQAEAQAKAQAAAAAAAAAVDSATRGSGSASRSGDRTPPPSSGGAGPVPASCAAYTGNKATGCTIMLQWGFGLDQMPCLEKMWTKESGWYEKSRNSSSGAYGIPQALPASKMAKYGADYLTNPVPQIKWGLGYIKDRYKSPCGAWSFWQAHNWY